MEKDQIDNINSLELEEILKIRLELEQYINVIDEHVITSKTDLNGMITYASSAFALISGYTEEELIGRSHNIIRHPDMPKAFFEKLWDTIKSEKTWSGEIKNIRKDGTYYWVNTKITPTYDHFGNHIGYTSVRQDITDRKKIEEVALTDELTGLYNRRYYNQIITKEINRAKRNKKVFSYLVLDIDYFKDYNDNYGHQKGDKALAKIGLFLDDYFKRATDIAFRLGGEEFCVIYSTKTVEQGIELAQNLCDGIQDLQIEHNYSDVAKELTVSLGLAIYNFQENNTLEIDADKLYKEADKVLYEAKKAGRNCVKSTIITT